MICLKAQSKPVTEVGIKPRPPNLKSHDLVDKQNSN